MEVMIYINPELRILLLPFQDRKRSRVALECVPREHGGAEGV